MCGQLYYDSLGLGFYSSLEVMSNYTMIPLGSTKCSIVRTAERLCVSIRQLLIAYYVKIILWMKIVLLIFKYLFC
jgi:hypothetical protein